MARVSTGNANLSTRRAAHTMPRTLTKGRSASVRNKMAASARRFADPCTAREVAVGGKWVLSYSSLYIFCLSNIVNACTAREVAVGGKCECSCDVNSCSRLDPCTAREVAVGGKWCKCFCDFHSCSLLYCSLGGASALVTFICVLFFFAPQVVRVLL
jgi:hypothetical protein